MNWRTDAGGAIRWIGAKRRVTRKIPASFLKSPVRSSVSRQNESGARSGAMPSACASDLRRLFETQRQYVSHFFEEVAYGSLRDFCQEVADCDGTVYFSGVGKSGFVAQKVSATMVSTGAKSAWLDPTDALRGDVGVLRANDVLVLFSKSGASDELRRLVPLARAKGARVVGVTSDERSALANDADTHVTLPLERELCPFDLAPVTSCAIQMLFGDTCCRRSHGTHLRETSRALLLGHLERPRIAAPNAPGARQARTGRHPAGHPRCDGPGRANAKYGVPENRGGRIGKSQLGFRGKSQLSQDGNASSATIGLARKRNETRERPKEDERAT